MRDSLRFNIKAGVFSMDRHFRGLLLMSALVWLPSKAVAQDQIPAARELITIAVRPDTDYPKTGRARLVRLLSVYCREVIKILPTNTPAEDAWVASEGNTTDIAKVRRLVASREYSRSQLTEIFVRCEQITDKLMKPGALTVEYEAANLVSLAINFNSDIDIDLYAKKLEMKSEELGLDFLPAVRWALLVASLRTLEKQ
jgi:hypothetical protein